MTIVCTDASCPRTFLTDTAMLDHAQAVHTHNEINRLVQDKLRATYGREGSYGSGLRVSSIYTWITDIADDWVVFEREGDGSPSLWKASYSITDGEVTLGAPVQVVRRTVYDAVPNGSTLEANA